MKTQATAKLRHLRMAPRKVRLVADLIRGIAVEKALLRLQVLKKEAKRPVLKLLESGIANATNNFQIEKDTLRVKSITVDGGPILYRWMPKAMGRATPIRKRTSHITIVLEGEVNEKKAKKESKKEEVKKEGKE